MLMRPNGRLHPVGIAYIQRVLGSPLDGEDIERIFDPDSDLPSEETSLRLQWREAVVAADVRETMRVRPARLDSAGDISFSGTPRRNLFANTDGPRFALVNWTLQSVLTFLAQARAIAVTEDTFQIDGTDIRDWTVARFFAHALRENHDPDFAESYAKTHVHYVSRRFTDPLRMVQPHLIAPGPLRSAPMTLEQFWGLAGTRVSRDREYRNRRARLDEATARRYARGLPRVEPQIIIGTQDWFNFLFGPGSFVGDLANPELKSALEDPRSRCDQLVTSTAIKAIARKQLDVVQILVHRQRIEVLDATMRPHDRWHNFKTEFYAAVVRAVVRNIVGPAWTVTAMDFKSQYLMSPLA
jgi:hypothetical protein